ncbi:hypothetical protein F3Y22_tig00110384pilonHSYRG00417 [Hibiscus syriacus]|uniref:Reverse transcriptase Ty1/copia-type domain-containing protein n=1 Tax=Hibiscus syriacus TaxID=106335 RepID=A0A6A3ARI2_HIBSY|nr:hypothetical protein F3Y22_tig00110384pilonHSYRG00417 [Hibiscus syriacus]
MAGNPKICSNGGESRVAGQFVAHNASHESSVPHMAEMRSSSSLIPPGFQQDVMIESEQHVPHDSVQRRSAERVHDLPVELIENLVVPVPDGKQPIDCKWVYWIKYNADGTVDWFKVRLVAKGFTKIEGIVYVDTFSPVAKMTSFKVLLALAAAHNWHLLQLDVNNAFLNNNLDEEVYMKPPLGYKAEAIGLNLICKLNKSIYEHSLFINGKNVDMIALLVYVENIILALLVYVDNIILAGKNLSLLTKDIGSLGKKPAELPIVSPHRLSVNEGELLSDPQLYR